MILLAAGVLLTVCGVALPFLAAAPDIVGGAGAPTFWYLVQHRLHGAPLAMILLGSSAVLAAMFCLFFQKQWGIAVHR